MKAKVNLKNIISYLQGKIRYKLFYSNFAFLIPKHIREQIQYRINSMDLDCYTQGQCKLCGCQTTALQMANKACDKPCYPKMLNKNFWDKIKTGRKFGWEQPEEIYWTVDTNKLKFIRHDR